MFESEAGDSDMPIDLSFKVRRVLYDSLSK